MPTFVYRAVTEKGVIVRNRVEDIKNHTQEKDKKATHNIAQNQSFAQKGIGIKYLDCLYRCPLPLSR